MGCAAYVCGIGELLHYIIKTTRCLDMYMNDQSLRPGNAKQLRLKTTPFFSREKEELPQAGFEPAMFCVLGRRSTN